jgi:outer membrane protein assembly complex protein YaeT
MSSFSVRERPSTRAPDPNRSGPLLRGAGLRGLALALALVIQFSGWIERASAESIDDPGTRTVREIRWVGVEALPTKEIEAAILTRRANWKPWVKSQPFDPATLDQDLERIRRLYARKGYYEADARAELEPAGEAVDLRIEVSEGRPILLETFEVTFVHRGIAEATLEPAALTLGLPLAIGEVFRSDDYKHARDEILSRAAERGYGAASIAGGAEVDRVRRTARVTWSLDPGPFVRLGPLTIEGLDRVDPALVRRELTLLPGEPYAPAALRRNQRALFALGLFRSVSIQPRLLAPPAEVPAGPSEAVWPMEIRCEERPPRSLGVAIGYGTEDRYRARLEWTHRNLFGGLRSLRLRGQYSYRVRGVEASFGQPRFLDGETRLGIDAQVSEETQPAFESRGASAGWLLQRPVAWDWKGRLGQRFEWRRVAKVEADAGFIKGDEGESFQLMIFTLGLNRSRLDSEIEPSRGSWFDLSIEPSFRELASQVNYTKLEGEARFFRPIGPTVLATRLHLGTLDLFARDRTPDLPVFKRFFSGGGASVRGFDLDELGPLDSDERPIGGLTLAEASLELRFPLWRELGGVAFVDAGQVNLDSFRLDAGEFFYSAGIGLRYRTPIGPLRLDFARILNPPTGLPDQRVHFSVGHAF